MTKVNGMMSKYLKFKKKLSLLKIVLLTKKKPIIENETEIVKKANLQYSKEQELAKFKAEKDNKTKIKSFEDSFYFFC